MRLTGETAAKIILSGALALGATACGEDNPSTTNEELRSFTDIQSELKVANLILREGQVEYETYIENLPDECQAAIQSYIPPDGIQTYTKNSEAVRITSAWCGPHHLDAIPELRDMFGDLVNKQGVVDGLDYELSNASVSTKPQG
jgi:hypothetical protein